MERPGEGPRERLRSEVAKSESMEKLLWKQLYDLEKKCKINEGQSSPELSTEIRTSIENIRRIFVFVPGI